MIRFTLLPMMCALQWCAAKDKFNGPEQFGRPNARVVKLELSAY